MKAWIGAAFILVACKGTEGTKSVEQPTGSTHRADIVLPVAGVKAATVLAAEGARPPVVYFADGRGTVTPAGAESWAELDAKQLTVATRSGSPTSVDKTFREAYAMGRGWSAAIREWDHPAPIDPALAADLAAVSNDPPPPPPANDDESGRTGTLTAVAVDHDGWPTRAAAIVGAVATDGKLVHNHAMIVMPANEKASKLVELVRATGASIAVSFNGKVRPLNVQFSLDEAPTATTWLEVRLTTTSLVVEAVPDVPVTVASLDELAAKLAAARDAHNYSADAPVDILVGADVDVQRLVDTIVALEAAKVSVIGVGNELSNEQLARRGQRIPATALGEMAAQGELDRAEIRRVVKESAIKLSVCYRKELNAKPGLRGTVNVQFFITPTGSVTSSFATGVDPNVAGCVADVFKSLTFPKPKHGGVQVNYPLVFST